MAVLHTEIFNEENMGFLKYIQAASLKTHFFLAVSVLFVGVMFALNGSTRPNLQAPTAPSLDSQSCVELRPKNEVYQEAAVSQPGRYCIATDFWQRRFCIAGHCAPAPHRHLLSIGGGDVTIDLKNHVLHSDGHSSGIVAYTQSNKGTMDADDPSFSFAQRTTRITIKNGVIDLRGLGIGIELIDEWNMLFLDMPIPEELRSYKKTEFILENLRIITDGRGIALEGDGNIIRNCVIESDGRAAIMMAGPNGLIEGNTIVLSNRSLPRLRPITFNKFMEGLYNPKKIYDMISHGRIPKAAIVLHQANNTIIRGNRIVVNGESSRRRSIYLNNSSIDVKIDDNTFVGIEDPVTMVNGSTAAMKNNRFEKGEPWWRF